LGKIRLIENEDEGDIQDLGGRSSAYAEAYFPFEIGSASEGTALPGPSEQALLLSMKQLDRRVDELELRLKQMNK
jgi:hypothetical protein